MGFAPGGALYDHLNAAATFLEATTAPSAGQSDVSSKVYENMQLAASISLFDRRRS
jgi:hypothetical protein